MNIIYFDHNSTTPILEAAKLEMTNLMDFPANPSSIHSYGRKAKYIIEEARSKIFKLLNLNAKKYNIVFTASGTESNNLIINNYKDKIVITSTSEHLSVLNCKDSCKKFILVNILEDGIIDLTELEDILKKEASFSRDILVSIIYANNETGIIQPIKRISEICHKYSAKLHTDAVQAIGKLEFDIEDFDVDFMTISGHKFGGPVGAGLLIYKKNIDLVPQIFGGGQEKNLRSGTENIVAIKGLEKALEITMLNLRENIINMRYLRDKLEELIKKTSSRVKIVGENVERLPNTSNIIMKGIASEKQLIEFDLENIAVSTGSACSSGKMTKSHVLKAMKLESGEIDCSIRVSLGANNNEDEVRKFVEIFAKITSKININ